MKRIDNFLIAFGFFIVSTIFISFFVIFLNNIIIHLFHFPNILVYIYLMYRLNNKIKLKENKED